MTSGKNENNEQRIQATSKANKTESNSRSHLDRKTVRNVYNTAAGKQNYKKKSKRGSKQGEQSNRERQKGGH